MGRGTKRLNVGGFRRRPPVERYRLMPLEERICLTVYPLTPLVSGGAITLTLSRDGGPSDFVGFTYDPLDADPQYSLMPFSNFDGDPYNTISVDGRVGNEILTMDFSYGAFSHSPSSPDVVILGGAGLNDTLVIKGDGGGSVTSGPGSVMFTDSTGGSTTVIFGGAVSTVEFESIPEPMSALTVGVGVVGLVFRRRRERWGGI
jgi:hypothetical protein